ncbi:MAG: FUSC family protein, partial [Sciscionella sp.]
GETRAEVDSRRGRHSGRRERIERWLDASLAGRATWLFALRLALCEAVALLAVHLLALQRPYWVMLTVAIVLKPDFGSVFARGVLRGGGTVVGVLLGTGILALHPRGFVLVLIVAVIAAILPVGQARNYGMFATFLTPLVIILLDLAKPGGSSLVLARLLDTLLGCAIVLIVGYLLWPGGRTPKVGERLASSIESLATYAARALTVAQGRPRGERYALRRRAYRALADLRTEFQRLVAEPSAAGRQAAAWWPVTVALERYADAITQLAVEIRAGEPAPSPDAVDTLLAQTTQLAESVRGQRRLSEPNPPESVELDGVFAELAAVYRALDGPDVSGERPLRAMRRLLPVIRR